ncbi:tetratricopeptide repeat protein [Actinomadura sp. HBU206391]|uniref:tetratricopeptide repeat protein n=1 Tax=Actinomadura sp. HBU206391 TaxID=2731692 RepID=UPI00164FC1F6|nr:tetratricopeptide repeat protein [Actinomadura sp. HBU206391]MBC6456500.1 tetratricopeptide repeat protein [Actinomadura sp. HBU206391]
MATFPGEARFGGDAVARDKIVHLNSGPYSAPEPPRQLPLDIHGFSGRGETLAKLDRLVEENQRALSPLIIAITGMPGIGKTALAVHWAHLMADHFPDGHIFIDLRGYSDRVALSPREALGQALRALNVPARRIPVDEDELASLYRSQLAKKRILILLDDAVGAEQVHPLLPGSSSCVVVVTARDDLAGLVARDHARTVPLDLLPAGEALELVRTVAGQERTDAEPEAATQLVRMCARLPLALSVAAANLATRPQQSVAEAVEVLSKGDRLSNLAVGRGLDKAVGAAFDLSYRGLEPELQSTFRLLGLVEGPSFTRQSTSALLAVTPEAAQRTLGRLEAANLVQAIASDRYQLHDLLREYARGRAEEEDDSLVRESALQRLATWYLTRAQQAGRFLDRYRRTIGHELAAPPVDVDPTERARHLEWFTAEYRNLIEVVRQTSRLGWEQLTWELADAVYDFFELRRYSHENIAVHRLGLDAAERQNHLPSQFFMRHHLAVAYRELGQAREAFAEAERAHRLSRQIRDRYGEGVALDNIARIHLVLSEYRNALAVSGMALTIRREIGDRHGEATTLDTTARGHQGLSDYQRAFDRAAEALVIRRDIGDVRGEAETLYSIARIYNGWGRASLALESADQALAIRREIGDRHGEGETLAFMGYLHMWLGRHLQARNYVENALRLRQAIADRQGEGQVLVYLSTILRRLGDMDEAVRAGLEALDILQELGDRHGEAEALNSLSRSYRRKGAYERAHEDAQRSLEISRSIGDRFGEATALNALALIARSRHQVGAARKIAARSFRLRRQIGDRRGEANSLDLLCKVYQRIGLLPKAHRTGMLACSIGAEVEDGYGRMVTLRVLAEIAHAMGDHDQAVKHIRDAMDLEKELDVTGRRSRTLRLYGVILMELGSEQDAAEAFAEAHRLEPASGLDED